MPRRRFNNNFIISLIVFAAVILIIAAAANRISEDTSAQQLSALETAVGRDITTCYALEGAYPPDLQYLKDHYGLSYDESRYYVDYRPIAANLRPDYNVIPIP